MNTLKLTEQEYNSLMLACCESEIIEIEKTQSHLNWQNCLKDVRANFGVAGYKFLFNTSGLLHEGYYKINTTYDSYSELLEFMYGSKKYNNSAEGVITKINPSYLSGIKTADEVEQEIAKLLDLTNGDDDYFYMEINNRPVPFDVINTELNRWLSAQFVLTGLQINHYFNRTHKAFAVSITFQLPDRLMAEALDLMGTKD